MRWIGWAMFMIFAASAVWFVRSCGSADPDAYVRQEAAVLRQQTTPPNAQVAAEPDISRTQSVAEMRWVVRTDLGWREYGEWVRRQLPTGWSSKTATDGELEFLRELPGDVEHVHIERMPGTPRPGVGVRVTFRSQPD